MGGTVELLKMAWRKLRTDLTSPSETGASQEDVLAVVAEGLSSTDTGVEFVYRSLDRLRDRMGADDLVAVIEEPLLGRQVFRAGRRPVDTEWARELVRSGAPGVHALPEEVDPVVAKAVVDLCSVALRLDIALHDSSHDHLTELLNRRAFDERLTDACARSARYGWPFGLILLDLDRFKDVNDRLGHPAGDDALRAVGEQLRHHLRAGDAAARLGGDEFAVLLPNLREASATDLVRRIEEALEVAVPGAGITLSAGVALSPAHGNTPTALYHRADQELYEQKRAGR